MNQKREEKKRKDFILMPGTFQSSSGPSGHTWCVFSFYAVHITMLSGRKIVLKSLKEWERS